MLNDIITAQLENHDSFYIYDEQHIRSQAQLLRTHFPDVDFFYSLKCNPNPHILRTIFSEGFGADAASLKEVQLAADAGLRQSQIYYSAPGKSPADLEGAFNAATIIADSIGELDHLERLAAREGTVAEIGVRVNPSFSMNGGDGLSAKFGIDEEMLLPILKNRHMPHLMVTGIHVHLQSQVLDSDKLQAYYRNVLSLADRVEAALGRPLMYINMGSGIGLAYAAHQTPLDIPALGLAAGKYLARYRNAHPYTRIFIESGRFCVGQSGQYVTTVRDRKVSRGKTWLILSNTLNGFIRPSIDQMVRPYPDAQPFEPLFTCRDAFHIRTLKNDPPSEQVNLVGNLCAGTDLIAEDILLPKLAVGDAVIIDNAGAYAAVLSPTQFSSLTPPAELFVTAAGNVLSD